VEKTLKRAMTLMMTTVEMAMVLARQGMDLIAVTGILMVVGESGEMTDCSSPTYR